MILIALFTLAFPLIWGKHWTHFALGAVVGALAAFLVGLFTPPAPNYSTEIKVESFYRSNSGALVFTFVSDGSIESDYKYTDMIRVSDDRDIVILEHVPGRIDYWTIRIPCWRWNVTMSKKSMKSMGFL